MNHEYTGNLIKRQDHYIAKGYKYPQIPIGVETYQLANYIHTKSSLGSFIIIYSLGNDTVLAVQLVAQLSAK